MLPWMLQDAQEVARRAQESQDGFFGGTMWLLIAVPVLAAIVVGAKNRYRKQTVREFHTGDFDREVLQSPVPTLVHFYRPWSIGDQCMIAQVEKIASKAHGFRVGFADMEKNPQLLSLFSNIGGPALLFFADGERKFQCEGVFDEADVMAEIREVMARRGGATADSH
ncbi:MAG: thioredoxin family protein [Planctomycetes bacterium]|nr:thioredoxin family protein [Planctomycetota bacterium]